jgi:AcrR family transcriptional regulator
VVTTAPTPIEQSGIEPSPRRATPADALVAARRMWLDELRIDMGRLAAGLGISRATLYNWSGGKDRLTAEVLWSFAAATLADARAGARGSGAAYLGSVVEGYIEALAGFEPLRRFVERDPEQALRVLACNRTPFQGRLIGAIRALIEEQQEAADYRPALDAETLAYLVVRIGESFIFNDVITGTEPDLAKAVEASRILLAAR